MRKHFLLLFLLTLLPFTGFAANLSEGTLLVPNLPYGTNAATHFAMDGFKLTVGGVVIEKSGYEIEGYYKTNGGARFTDVNTFEVRTDVYYVKVKAKGDNTGELQGTFQVVKRPLTISFSTTEGKNTKVFDNNATPEVYTYTLKDGATDVTADAADYGLQVGRANPTNYNVGSYAFTYSVSATNYTLTREEGNTNKYEITKKDLAELTVDFDFNAEEGGYTYSGVEQAPTITAAQFQNADVTFDTYWYTTEITNVNLATLNTDDAVKTIEARVGDNKYYAMIVGKGNYTGRKFVDTWKFNIAKKAANVKLTKKTKVYDGVEGDPTIVKINYTGLVPADAQAGLGNFDNNIRVKFSAEGDHIKKGEYSVEAYVVNADNKFTRNYTYELNTTNNKGNFYEITARPITITARNLTLNFGDIAADHIAAAVVIADETPANINADLTVGTIVEGQADQILGDLEFALSDDYDADDAATWVGAYILKKKAAIDAAHYINNYDVTLTPANVVFNKTPQTVFVNTIEKVYGSTIAQTDFSYDADEDLKEGTVEYQIWNAEGTLKITDWTNLTPNVYQIKMDADKAEADPNGQRTIGDIQPGYLIITQKTLNIVLNDVTVNVGATKANLQQFTSQADYANQLEGQLVGNDAVNFEIRFADADAEGTSLASVGSHPNGITGHAFTAADNEPLAPADQYDLKQNAYYIFNFTGGNLTVLAAKTLQLNENDADLATRIADAAAACTEDPATLYNVSWTSTRTLKREVWTAMVLPFATTVKEISDKLDYAVVDILDEDNTTNDMHLKLHMGAIAANQPFIVKYYKEDVEEELYTEAEANEYNATLTGAKHAGDLKNAEVPAVLYATKDEYNAAHPDAEVTDEQWEGLTDDQKIKTPGTPAEYYTQDEADAHNAGLGGAKHVGDVKVAAINYATFDLKDHFAFANKTIEYAAASKNEDGNVFVENENNGHQFIGVYSPVEVTGGEYKWINQNGVLKDGATYKEQGKTVPMRRLISYFKLNTNTTTPARILIDEPDGTTTVINAVTAESMNVQAEGWYTLNGVKLQGVPTQKGIYINNGKKVVIK